MTETVYEYRDAGDVVRYEVVRQPEKRFVARQPDGNGGHAFNLNRVERVPYRLPAVVEAVGRGEQIYVTEGEKDADRLCELGLAATTNAGGAAWNWPLEWHEHFKGVPEAVIFADNDGPGRSHAEQVASVLCASVPVIRIVELPGVAEHGDVSDWLEAGGTKEQLLELVEGTDQWRPAPPQPDVEQIDADFLSESVIDWSRARDEVVEAAYLVEPLIAAGRSHVLTGPMGGGKSLSVQWMIAMACLGRRVLGRPKGEPLRALYLDAENSLEDILERLEAFGVDPDELSRAGTLRYCHLPNIAHGLDSWKDAQVLVRHAREHRADIVIIDTATATVGGGENDADTWSALARLVTAPLKAEGRSLIRLDHPGKDPSKGTRGSSAKLADCDVAWTLAPAERGGFIFRCRKRRMPWIAQKVALHQVEQNGVIAWREVEQEWPAGTEAAAKALEQLYVPLTATCNEALKALRTANEGRRKEVVLAAQKYRRESRRP